MGTLVISQIWESLQVELWHCVLSCLCPTLCDPRDCSPPGSPVHEIFQARILELGAIAFSVIDASNV